MADDQDNQERGRPEDLGQDPFVERRRPDPSQPPEAVRILEGLLGDSDREGYKRLYFNRALDHYAEFRTEDVAFRESIPSEQAPLVGYEATRVGIRRDATIEFTRVRTPRPVDEFDLDVRLAAPRELRADVEEERFGGTRGCPPPRTPWGCPPPQTQDPWGCPPPHRTQAGGWGCPPPTKLDRTCPIWFCTPTNVDWGTCAATCVHSGCPEQN
jgi:hypothetical protein